jgi:hypothetical protein
MRIAAATTLAVGLLLGSAAVASAAPAQTLIGPECAPNVVSAVLVSLAANHVVVTPGQQFQYLQIAYVAPPGGGAPAPTVQLCTVTVPQS